MDSVSSPSHLSSVLDTVCRHFVVQDCHRSDFLQMYRLNTWRSSFPKLPILPSYHQLPDTIKVTSIIDYEHKFRGARRMFPIISQLHIFYFIQKSMKMEHCKKYLAILHVIECWLFIVWVSSNNTLKKNVIKHGSVKRF